MTREEAINNLKKILGFSPTYDEAFYSLFPNGKQPSLPSDVDEAANEIAYNMMPVAMITNCEDGHPDYDAWGALREKFIEGFKAGAEWQSEQDQPITGNSLEQEWLRYVDKEKKKYDGDLPSYGEYGWLCIARHFANWQKAKMLEEAVEGEVVESYGCEKGENGEWREVATPTIRIEATNFSIGDKLKVIVVKED